MRLDRQEWISYPKNFLAFKASKPSLWLNVKYISLSFGVLKWIRELNESSKIHENEIDIQGK